jgi:ATP/maltotriose-dependent transcriptional regulator MalT
MHIAGDPAGAEQVLQESLALFEELGDEHGRAVILHRLSITAMIRGDLDRARELVEASHAIHARRDDWWQRTWSHAQTVGTRGAIAREAGDDDYAYDQFVESAELSRAAGAHWWHGGLLGELAALSLRRGRVEEAEGYARESLVIARDLGNRSGRVFGVGLLACVAAERGDLQRAGRLWARSRTTLPWRRSGAGSGTVTRAKRGSNSLPTATSSLASRRGVSWSSTTPWRKRSRRAPP